MSRWLTRQEIESIGFANIGEDVLISDSACFYGASEMRIGNHVRIDDFSLFVGKISIGSYSHIGAFASFHASSGSITILDFSGVSSRVTIYAASDDYSGNYMMGYGIPKEYKHVVASDIFIAKYCHIGTGSILLPGANLSEGTALAALTLVNIKTTPWTLYSGNPCTAIRQRNEKEKNLAENVIKAEGKIDDAEELHDNFHVVTENADVIKKRILTLLTKIFPQTDFTASNNLVDDYTIDSLSMTVLVSELSTEFGVKFDVEELIPENFNSVDAMVKTIQHLKAK